MTNLLTTSTFHETSMVPANPTGPQRHGEPPCLYLQIPLQVAHDTELSDGAKLLLGEIWGLQRRYGRCTASDRHFAERLGKSSRSIPRLITELSKRHCIMTGRMRDGQREIRVASRFLGGQDVALGDAGQGGEAQKDGSRRLRGFASEGNAAVRKNASGEVAESRKNALHKTQENPKKKESRKTPTETEPPLRIVARSAITLSEEDGAGVDVVVDSLMDFEHRADYESLMIRCREQGRLDCWNIALASTRKAMLAGTLHCPVAYFRSVLTKSLHKEQTEAAVRTEVHKDRRWGAHLVAENVLRNSGIPVVSDADIAYGLTRYKLLSPPQRDTIKNAGEERAKKILALHRHLDDDEDKVTIRRCCTYAELLEFEALQGAEHSEKAAKPDRLASINSDDEEND